MNERAPMPLPVGGAERITSLDVLRGVALCGILAMNIRTFAMPESAYFYPYSWGDMTGLNGLTWHVTELLASSKFITLFSLLFGAGIVLMNDRARTAGGGFAGLHYRRMFVLLLFGLFHSYLMWEGDILVSYALCGMLAFLFRNVRPGRLLISALVFLVLGSALLCSTYWASLAWPEDVVTAFRAGLVPPMDAMQAQIQHMRGGFGDQMQHRLGATINMHTVVFPYYMLWRVTGTMLLGMALFQWGVLTGQARPAVYRAFILLALVVGLPLTMFGIMRQDAIGWDPIRSFFAVSLWGYWASFATALGWLGLAMLWCRSGFGQAGRTRLAAVGRMALTNYLMHTVLCSFIFYGYGFKLFGSVSHLEQLALVTAVWAIQLWWSPWWLARYRFGPAEWLWRSLAYGKKQTFRRKGSVPHASS